MMAGRDNIQVFGNNRAMSYWSPSVHAAMLQNRAVEVRAFATDRQLSFELLMSIAAMTVRLGRIPDMAMYGLAPDDERAFTDFLADVFLNTEETAPARPWNRTSHKALRERVLNEASLSGGMGAYLNHFQGEVKRSRAREHDARRAERIEIKEDTPPRVRVRIGADLVRHAMERLSEIGIQAIVDEEKQDAIIFDLQGLDQRDTPGQLCTTLDRVFEDIFPKWPGFKPKDVMLLAQEQVETRYPIPTPAQNGTLYTKNVKTIDDMIEAVQGLAEKKDPYEIAHNAITDGDRMIIKPIEDDLKTLKRRLKDADDQIAGLKRVGSHFISAPATLRTVLPALKKLEATVNNLRTKVEKFSDPSLHK